MREILVTGVHCSRHFCLLLMHCCAPVARKKICNPSLCDSPFCSQQFRAFDWEYWVVADLQWDRIFSNNRRVGHVTTGQGAHAHAPLDMAVIADTVEVLSNDSKFALSVVNVHLDAPVLYNTHIQVGFI